MGMNKGMYTSNSCEWETPLDFFKDLDAEFHFDVDVCATPENENAPNITPKRTTDWKKRGAEPAG